MGDAYIVAAFRELDGVGDTSEYAHVEANLSNLGVHPLRLTIDPLRAGWYAPVEENHFRSGCAPVQAIATARDLIKRDATRALVIEGHEPLKTGYERDERHRMMAIYGADYSIPEAYTDVAREFIKRHGISKSAFKEIAKLLFENYERTFYRTNSRMRPDEKWFEFITELFRGVDCANPVVDFSGKLLICESSVAERVALPGAALVEIAGVGLGFTGDGRENVSRIAAYSHLEEAYRIACRQADTDFSSEYRAGRALLEAYTCFPVAPMGLLLASGIASSINDIPLILQEHEVTVTGGMNLAGAPWNNPALNALITMYELLNKAQLRIAAVHGNGGMGFSQGIALLKRRERTMNN